MSDARTQLEEERRIINAATEGRLETVWDHQQLILKPVSASVHDEDAHIAQWTYAIMPGRQSEMDECDTDDAERLAHSWNALPLRNAQVQAVLALHRKSPLWGHEDRCEDTTGGHREEHHELIDGELWCRDIVDEWTCAECAEVQDIDSMGERPAWPCATVRAIEEAGA